MTYDLVVFKNRYDEDDYDFVPTPVRVNVTSDSWFKRFLKWLRSISS